MPYDLAELARQNGRRQSFITLRSIETSRFLETALQRIARQVVAEASTALTEDVMPAYEAARRAYTGDEASDPLAAALSALSERLTRLVLSFGPLLQDWALKVEGWHRQRFGAGIKAATGVDMFPFLTIQPVQEEITAAQQWASGLIRGLADDLRRQVDTMAWDAFVSQRSRRDLAKELAGKLAIGRKRADLIASDQTVKLASHLDKLRQQEAGIEEFTWVTAGDDRVRPSHRALNGKVFRWDKPPAIGLPGTPIRCRCRGQAFLRLDD